MSQDPSIKIRVLPRAGDQKVDAGNQVATKADAALTRRRLVVAGSVGCFVLAAALMVLDKPTPASKSPAPKGKSDFSSIADPSRAAVSRHLNDTLLREKMMTRQAEVATQSARSAALSGEAPNMVMAPMDGSYGVHLDQEDTVAKIAEDLNHRPNGGYSNSVEDLITSRLANRKWLNELDKAERINYIRNFLRSAYEQGYEVQLDQNLVVVSVKRVNRYQRVNIDNVINKMAQQGQ